MVFLLLQLHILRLQHTIHLRQEGWNLLKERYNSMGYYWCDFSIEPTKAKFHKLGFGKKYQGHFMKDLEMKEFLKEFP